MSAVEDRLAELGLAVPEVAKPVAAYVPAVRSKDHVFTSGQLPMRSGELIVTGKVGGEVSAEEYEVEESMEKNRISNISTVSSSCHRAERSLTDVREQMHSNVGYIVTLALNLSLLIPLMKNPKVNNYVIVL